MRRILCYAEVSTPTENMAGSLSDIRIEVHMSNISVHMGFTYSPLYVLVSIVIMEMYCFCSDCKR